MRSVTTKNLETCVVKLTYTYMQKISHILIPGTAYTRKKTDLVNETKVIRCPSFF